MSEDKDQVERKPVMIRLQPAVYQALKLVAADDKTTISEIIESMLVKMLSKRKIPDNVKQVFSG